MICFCLFSLLALLIIQDPGDCGFEPDDPVKVTVAAILASERDTTVDKKLECFAREVKKLEPTLTGFRFARVTCKALEPGVSYRFPLLDGKAAYVSIQHAADRENRVRLMVKPPQMGEIVYICACGKYFPIMTRYETKDNDRLIIAVMVWSCK